MMKNNRGQGMVSLPCKAPLWRAVRSQVLKKEKGGQDGDDKGDQRLFCGGSEGESWACCWTIMEIAPK